MVMSGNYFLLQNKDIVLQHMKFKYWVNPLKFYKYLFYLIQPNLTQVRAAGYPGAHPPPLYLPPRTQFTGKAFGRTLQQDSHLLNFNRRKFCDILKSFCFSTKENVAAFCTFCAFQLNKNGAAFCIVHAFSYQE